MSARLIILSNRVPIEFVFENPWVPRIKGLLFSQDAAQKRAIARMCMARLRAERRGEDVSRWPVRHVNLNRKATQ